MGKSSHFSWQERVKLKLRQGYGWGGEHCVTNDHSSLYGFVNMMLNNENIGSNLSFQNKRNLGSYPQLPLTTLR